MDLDFVGLPLVRCTFWSWEPSGTNDGAGSCGSVDTGDFDFDLDGDVVGVISSIVSSLPMKSSTTRCSLGGATVKRAGGNSAIFVCTSFRTFPASFQTLRLIKRLNCLLFVIHE